MNDKNFIEELRKKREKYGVIQTRLAIVHIPQKQSTRSA